MRRSIRQTYCKNPLGPPSYTRLRMYEGSVFDTSADTNSQTTAATTNLVLIDDPGLQSSCETQRARRCVLI